MPIIVYNRTKESYDDGINVPIYRPNILGNPFTHIKDKQTKAQYVVNTREEAIERYSHYFDVKYASDLNFKKAVDAIYELYKSGAKLYLECYCHPQRCHGDIIAEKLQQRLIKEKLKKYEENKI